MSKLDFGSKSDFGLIFCRKIIWWKSDLKISLSDFCLAALRWIYAPLKLYSMELGDRIPIFSGFNQFAGK